MTVRASGKASDSFLLWLVLLLFGVFLFLALRASGDNHWSDWGVGDAQTMLSLHQWQQGGWLNNYLLFKPQGYAAMVDLLDQEGLRQHAHGICPLSSPRVGPRLLYTHYPSGYLIPYALLALLGISSLYVLQLFSAVISLLALFFMYRLFALTTRPSMALMAVAFYALSPVFLNYADSLANMPIDDFLRFGFMLAVALSTRSQDSNRFWLGLAWMLSFLMSLSSFDSVFFIYLWLVGWYLLEKKGFCWKVWAIFALAPLLAHGLQFLQNVWYLGWFDAARDITDTFLTKQSLTDAAAGGVLTRIISIFTALKAIFSRIATPAYGPVIVLLVFAADVWLWPQSGATRSATRLLPLLFLCGAAYALLLPNGAMMAYQGRQLLPFMSLLFAILAFSVIETLCGRRWQGMFLSLAVRSLSLVILLAGVALTHAHASKPEWKAYFNSEEQAFVKKLKDMPTRYEPVYFEMSPLLSTYNDSYVPGYPQVLPFSEYYAGKRLILCFERPELLARDLSTLLDRSPAPFSPVILASDPEAIKQVFQELSRQDRTKPSTRIRMEKRSGAYIADLTPYLRQDLQRP